MLVIKEQTYVFKETVKFKRVNGKDYNINVKLTADDVSKLHNHKNNTEVLSDEQLLNIVFKGDLQDFIKECGKYYVIEAYHTVIGVLDVDMGFQRKKRILESAATIVQKHKKTHTK